MIFILRQFSSFVAVGFIAAAVQYSVLIGLVEGAGIHAVTAALIAYAAGGVVSYGLSRRHVFPSTVPHHAAAARFAIVAAVGFGLTYLFMSVLVTRAKLPYLLAQVVTTGMVMLWNFIAHKMWTFRASKTPSASLAFVPITASAREEEARRGSPRHCRLSSGQKPSPGRK